MIHENCEPWGYVAPVVAANDVAALVRRATHLLNFKVNENYTAFLRAAELGDIDRVEELLPAVDVNHADEGGRTALILAATNGQGGRFSTSIRKHLLIDTF